jgi:hypothetical protein
MTSAQRRMARERHTVFLMIGLSCRERHGSRQDLCSRCRELWDYAQRRLDLCPFAEEKPTCVACPIHCYTAAMRERVRDVMRYAGPRMLRRHPVLAVRHLLDGKRPLSAKAESIKARRQSLVSPAA